MAPVRKYVKRFVPLESNPVEMTALMHGLGVSDSLELVDVWSIDDPLQLSVIPRPVLALILVLPASEQYEKRRAATLQTNTKDPEQGDLIWIKQTIDNACGLYAILHAPPDVQDEVDVHYVSLVKLPDGFVYELDGDAYAPTKTNIKLEDDADLLKEPVLERMRG